MVETLPNQPTTTSALQPDEGAWQQQPVHVTDWKKASGRGGAVAVQLEDENTEVMELSVPKNGRNLDESAHRWWHRLANEVAEAWW